MLERIGIGIVPIADVEDMALSMVLNVLLTKVLII